MFHKRLLLLTHAFPPIAAPESYLSAKMLGNIEGYEVDVITSTGHGWARFDNSLDDYIEKKFKNVYRVNQPKWVPYFLFKMFARLELIPDKLIFSSNAVYDAAMNLDLAKYDALVSWSQWHSIHIPAIKIKRQYPNLTWMAHFSDPWVDNPFCRYNFFTFHLNKFLEKRVIKNADRLSFTTEATADVVMSKYPSKWRQKVSVQPHSYDPILYKNTNVDSPKLNFRKREYTVRYIGSFYGIRTPSPLIHAISEIIRTSPQLLSDVKFELIGEMPPFYFDNSIFRQLPEGLVTLIPPVSYSESLKLMQSSDLLLIVDAPMNEGIFLPSKLVDYLGTKKMIFGITPPGISAEIIKKMGGWVADPGSLSQIVEGLKNSIALIKANGTVVQHDFYQKFQSNVVSEDFLAAIVEGL